MNKYLTLPERGLNRADLLRKMEAEKSQDADWRNGRSWSLVYYGGDEHTEFLKQAYGLYFSENGLSGAAFPSLRKFEAEVVAMILSLLGGKNGEVGTMTSGGTESILLAVKTYRDWARIHRPEVTCPEMLIPVSAHPAFFKAAQYFDVRPVRVGLNSDYRVSLNQLQEKFSPQTIFIVGSAPSYPQGVIDAIVAMGAFAAERNVGLHVDACLGGFLLPFVRKLGYPVPAFDFTVPGVTSISADLHKNGYAAKGASAILYRNVELRRFQYFVDPDWTGGVYGSPTMLGTRPGGAIAAAWAAMMSLGEEGYLRLAQQTMHVTEQLIQGISAIPGLDITGSPDMSVLAFGAKDIDVFVLAKRMAQKGWRLDRQRNPDSLHMIATANHGQSIQPFLHDLALATVAERSNPSRKTNDGPATLYGVTAGAITGASIDEAMRSQMDTQFEFDD